MTECAIVVVCGYRSFDAKSQSHEVQRYLMTRKFFPDAEANLSNWAGTCYSESCTNTNEVKEKERKLRHEPLSAFPSLVGAVGFFANAVTVF
jgi:hypothetical protein